LSALSSSSTANASTMCYRSSMNASGSRSDRAPSVVVACAQLTSRGSLTDNLARCAALVAEAAARGAKLVALPENFALLAPNEQAKFEVAETLPGPIVHALGELAQTHGVWIIGGGMPEKAETPERVYNTCVVLDDAGALRASYRKIHLF